MFHLAEHEEEMLQYKKNKQKKLNTGQETPKITLFLTMDQVWHMTEWTACDPVNLTGLQAENQKTPIHFNTFNFRLRSCSESALTALMTLSTAVWDYCVLANSPTF